MAANLSKTNRPGAVACYIPIRNNCRNFYPSISRRIAQYLADDGIAHPMRLCRCCANIWGTRSWRGCYLTRYGKLTPRAFSNFGDGLFYEGTVGSLDIPALLVIFQPETAKPVQKLEIAPQVLRQKKHRLSWGPKNLYEWTWTSHTLLRLRPLQPAWLVETVLPIPARAGGMTRTTKELVRHQRRHLDPALPRSRDISKKLRHIVVKDGAKAIDQLNET